MFTEFTALACLSIWTSRPAALAISTNLIFVSSANLRLRRIFFWSAALLTHFRAAGQMTGHSIHVNRQIGRFPVFFLIYKVFFISRLTDDDVLLVRNFQRQLFLHRFRENWKNFDIFQLIAKALEITSFVESQNQNRVLQKPFWNSVEQLNIFILLH